MKDYLLNSAVELNQLTGDLSFALGRYPICDVETIFNSASNNLEAIKVLTDFFNHWYRNIATPVQKAATNIVGISSVGFILKSLTEEVSSDLVSSFAKTTKTGIFETNNDKKVDSEHNDMKALTSSIRAGIEESVLHMKSNAHTELLYGETKKVLKINHEEEIYERPHVMNMLSSERFIHLARQIDNLCSRYEKDTTNIDFNLVKSELKVLNPNRTEEKNDKTLMHKLLDIKDSKIEKTVKKTIKRSIKTFSSLFGNKNINLFISGDGFIYQGKIFNYKFSRSSYSIKEHTMNPVSMHVPFNFEIYNKDNVILCSACLIFDQTPIIDQITAICMHISSEQEELILETANFFSRSNDFFEDPYFKNKFKFQEKKVIKKDYSNIKNSKKFDKNISINELNEIKRKAKIAVKNNLFDFFNTSTSILTKISTLDLRIEDIIDNNTSAIKLS
jgi:hypothetical protein